MQLNDKQKQAVEYTQGPLLVIAGAGSGKTRVLTERLKNIFTQKLARPEQTLTVTFTNKAANEIKQRIISEIKNTTYMSPWMGTFHSIAVRILRRDGEHINIGRNFTIYDADDQLSLVKKVMKDLNISTKNFSPKSALAGISSAKQELVDYKTYFQNSYGTYEEKIAPIYEKYQKDLNENLALDFDDLLMQTVKLLVEVPEIKQKYGSLFKYILVDEYQDTNHAQYMMMKLLSEYHGNIFVVGDDDQSIYSWRGANIRNILEFEKDFANARIIKLEQNYRSTQKILKAGNSIVTSIGKRKSKKLWTDNDEGENISLYKANDDRDEAFWVLGQIDALLRQGKSADDIAVLYRMNAQSRSLEEAFLKMGISYQIVGNVRFYERREIKDILAFLRIIYNPNDNLSLMRIINVPSRKIGKKTVEKLMQYADRANLGIMEYLLGQRLMLEGNLREFADIAHDIIKFSQQSNLPDLINYVLERTSYLSLYEEDTEENFQRKANIKELKNVSEKYSQEKQNEGLRIFLEEVALVEAQVDEKGYEKERVTLMTVHSAKGLEFKYVFVVGLEEGLFPHSRSFSDMREMDEERRLMYVAVTRAKSKLYLSYCESRMMFGSIESCSPSRFISDISSDLIDYDSWDSSASNLQDTGMFQSENKNNENEVDSDSQIYNISEGERVQHSHFGKGKIVSIDDEYVIVNFDQHGTKELATDYANLVKL